MTSVLDELDAAAPGPVIVWGSLPPEGRDYDLVCVPQDAAPFAAALRTLGFSVHRPATRWIRVSDCELQVVDLVPADRLGIPGPEIADLFAAALPLPGHTRMFVPGPVHELLLQTLKGTPGVPLPRHRRARLEMALRADADGWEHAWLRATRWGIEEDLERLKLAWRTGLPLAAPVPRLRSRVRSRVRSRIRSPMKRPDRATGWLVSLSGLDGSGKSLQARLLRAAMDNLGQDTVIEWARLSHNAGLDTIARPVKRLLSIRTRPGPATGPEPAGAASDPAPQPAPRPAPQPAPQPAPRRVDHRLVTQSWALIVALANAFTYRRVVRRHTRRGRNVICDRYLLDSYVQLRFRYGRQREFALQRLLLRIVTPRPQLSYLLVVPPETANSRKADQFTLPELGEQAQLYVEESARLPVRAIDGSRAAEEVFAQIVREVLDELPE